MTEVVARYIIEGYLYTVQGCLENGAPFYMLYDNNGQALNLADPFLTLPSRDTVMNYLSTRVH